MSATKSPAEERNELAALPERRLYHSCCHGPLADLDVDGGAGRREGRRNVAEADGFSEGRRRCSRRHGADARAVVEDRSLGPRDAASFDHEAGELARLRLARAPLDRLGAEEAALCALH